MHAIPVCKCWWNSMEGAGFPEAGSCRGPDSGARRLKIIVSALTSKLSFLPQ